MGFRGIKHRETQRGAKLRYSLVKPPKDIHVRFYSISFQLILKKKQNLYPSSVVLHMHPDPTHLPVPWDDTLWPMIFPPKQNKIERLREGEEREREGERKREKGREEGEGERGVERTLVWKL